MSGASANSSDGVALTTSASSSTSLGAVGGSAGAPPGTGGEGAGSGSTTAAAGGSGAAGGTGGDGGNGAVGASSTGGGGSTSGGGSTASDGSTGGSGGTTCAPSEEVCDGVDNDCDDVPDEGQVCPDGCVGASFESHSYLFCDRPRPSGGSEPSRSWSQAMQFCLVRGLNLTLIESEAENDFIYETLVRLELSGDVWMGATDQEDEGFWTWADGESSDDWIPFYDQYDEEPIDGAFNDWRPGEPNDDGSEDCGIFEDLGGDERAWDDRSCQRDYDLFVCEALD